MNSHINEIQTTPLYWDCECKEKYIHHFTEPTCTTCKAERIESPDSRLNEIGVDEILYPHTPERNAYILRELLDYICEEQLKSFVQKIVSEAK
jgi:hypothetical protein